jgi:hypothetical protein
MAWLGATMQTLAIITIGASALGLLSSCGGPASNDEGGEATSGPVGPGGDDADAQTGSGGDTTPGGGSSGRADEGTGAPQPGDDDADSGAGPAPVSFDLGTLPDAPGAGACVQDVDIVFVMDVSTTMGGFLATLADEILAVDQALAQFDLPSDPHYGLVVFVDDAAILNTGQPYPDALALQADFQMWSTFTASNQQVGGGNSNGTWPENSLDALWLAANGFLWRPAESTLRLVIHTTDDTFWDGPTVGNNIPIQHGYAETVMALQDAQVRVFSFADEIGGSCSCLDVSMGWSTPYEMQTPIPEATDGAVYDINAVLSGAVSLGDAIFASVEESYCDPYDPVG